METQINQVISKPAYNVALLNEIADYIAIHPEEFDMKTFHEKRGEVKSIAYLMGQAIPMLGYCHTVGCIAHHAVRAIGGDTNCEEIEELARVALGLTEDEAYSLFYVDNWPDVFRVHYESLGDADSRAKFAASRIRHFITTGE